MKINIEIECTPEEARHFLGLPNVQPLHAKLMAEVENRMRQALSTSDPTAFVEGWTPLSRNLQEVWGRMMQAAAASLKMPPDAAETRRKPESDKKTPPPKN